MEFEHVMAGMKVIPTQIWYRNNNQDLIFQTMTEFCNEHFDYGVVDFFKEHGFLFVTRPTENVFNDRYRIRLGCRPYYHGDYLTAYCADFEPYFENDNISIFYDSRNEEKIGSFISRVIATLKFYNIQGFISCIYGDIKLQINKESNKNEIIENYKEKLEIYKIKQNIEQLGNEVYAMEDARIRSNRNAWKNEYDRRIADPNRHPLETSTDIKLSMMGYKRR